MCVHICESIYVRPYVANICVRPYMDTPIRASIYGHPYMCVHIWTPLYVCPYMDTPIRTSIYGHPYMLVHIWTPLYVCPYMDTPICVSIYGHPYICTKNEK